ncbi:MAG: Mov34/MPN/PAD-1 family protein [Thermoplasmata archaeon]
MSTPKVISETKREVKHNPPPPMTHTRKHYWLAESSEELYRSIVLSSGVFPVYISKKAEERIRNHALNHGDDGIEVMGLLLGEVFEHMGTQYAIVRDVATTTLEASEVSVKFDKGNMGELFDQLDGSGFDYMIVGWYHSHPGHSCFMSPTDIRTQKAMFSEGYHCAIVVDPLKSEIEAYTLDGDGYKPIPFTVYWEEYEDSYGKLHKRKRRKN